MQIRSYTRKISLSKSVPNNVDNANNTSSVKMNAKDGRMSQFLKNISSLKSPTKTGVNK